jgi:hypothetical protein
VAHIDFIKITIFINLAKGWMFFPSVFLTVIIQMPDSGTGSEHACLEDNFAKNHDYFVACF